MHRGLMLVALSSALTAFGKYEPEVNWIWREGVGASIETAASYFDGDNWEGGSAANAPTVSANFGTIVDVKYVRFDRDLSLGGVQAVGPNGYSRGINSSPRLILVSDDKVIDTCASISGSSYPVENIDLYADHDHADWSYFTSLNLAGDTLYAGQMVLAWGVFAHRLDWYAKEPGGARTNALAATVLYQGSGNISIYAPESSATNVTGQWTGTAGSRFLHRTGADHTLPVGTLVHGAGIPEGTFLKRLFTHADIELSQPLTADLDGDVVFEAQTARVFQHFDQHQLQGANVPYFRVSKYRQEDDVVVDIGTDNAANGSHVAFYDSDSAWLPATFAIHDGTRVRRAGFGNTHILFAEAGPGLKMGYPISEVGLPGANGETRITVASGKEASIFAVTNMQHGLVKDGAGTLYTGFRHAGAANNGCVTAKEGVLVLSNLVSGVQEPLAAVAVAADATLRIDGDFICASLSVEPGAHLVISAGGRLVVTTGTLDGMPAFEGEGELIYAGTTGKNDPPMYESPAPAVAGTPAFWVDACTLTNATPAGELETVGGVTYVSRWNDCRSSAAGGEHFATNRWSRPSLVLDGAAGPYVKIPGSSNDADESTLCALVWDRPITNIRHVFYVFDPTDGGGTILGNTVGVPPDFLRGGVDRNNSIIYSGGPNSYVVNATVYLNEVPTNRMASLAAATAPSMIDLPLDGPAAANAFGTIYYYSLRKDLAGKARIHEYIIYTNELTHAERFSTLAYLKRKWKNLPDVAFTTFPDGEELGRVSLNGQKIGVSAAAGESVGISGIEGAGTFVKTGAGNAYLTDAQNVQANVRVQEGMLSVRSSPLELENPVQDTYLHVDASKTNTLTWSRVDGVDRITKWRDEENGLDLTLMTATSTNQPRVRLNALNGLTMVDFGPAMGSRNSFPQDHAALSFPGSLKLQTIFSVLDTAGGGGALLGGQAGRNDTPTQEKYHGLWRDVQSWPNWYQQPLIMGTVSRQFEGKTLNNSNASGDYVDMTKTEVRLNHQVVDQANTGFTGGFDMFSVRSTSTMRSNLLGGIHYGWSFGGMSYGEVIYYERYLSFDEVGRVERYLAKKWFNRTLPMWRPADLGVVTVDAAAELQVEGGAPLTVRGLAGSGTISGDVVLSADGELAVEVVNGALQPLSVTGALTLPETGTLRVTGDVGSLAPGRYTLIANAGLVAGSMAGWDVQATSRPRRLFRLICEDGALKADVFARGTAFIFR